MFCFIVTSTSVFVVGKDSGKITGRIVDSDMHDVGRFLNRLLGLAPEIQNRSVTCELKSDLLMQLESTLMW